MDIYKPYVNHHLTVFGAISWHHRLNRSFSGSLFRKTSFSLSVPPTRSTASLCAVDAQVLRGRPFGLGPWWSRGCIVPGSKTALCSNELVGASAAFPNNFSCFCRVVSLRSRTPANSRTASLETKLMWAGGILSSCRKHYVQKTIEM